VQLKAYGQGKLNAQTTHNCFHDASILHFTAIAISYCYIVKAIKRKPVILQLQFRPAIGH